MHRKKKKENGNTTMQNLWDSVKAVLRGRSIAIQAYLKKQERHQVKKPNFTPKTTRKRRTELQNRRKEIIKIRADIREKK